MSTQKTYTRDEVTAALNAAADLLGEHEYETSGTIRDDDRANLLVNAAGYLLDHPGATLAEIIPAEYENVEPDYSQLDTLDEDEPDPEKGSARWNELVTATVLGWIA